MTTVRDALIQWMGILSKLPRGTGVQVAEEGATPGAGAESVNVVLVRDDMSAAALSIVAGMYDGEPRVFARVFEGTTDQVAKASRAWRDEVQR